MNQRKISEDMSKRPKGKLLVDSLPIRLQLVEDGGDGGKIVVRGEFARSGVATENKRVYPKGLWLREIRKMAAALRDRRVFGELDHPQDGRTMLSRASHLLTGLQVMDDGLVMGEAEVMDTARGKDLKAMLKAGAKVGVSSRGYGSTESNQKGEEVVQEDYNLVTFDFVAEPADSTAYPEVFSESKSSSKSSSKSGKETLFMEPQAQREADQKMAKKFAARVEQDVKDKEKEDDAGSAQAEQFERDILSNLGKLSAEARERIRAEMLSDPAVGRAKAAVEAIKDVLRPFVIPEDAQAAVQTKDEEIGRLHNAIKERDLKLKEAMGQIEQLAGLAREAGYKFFLERALSGNPDKGVVIQALGDLHQFENAESLKSRVEGICAELQAQRTEAAKGAEAADKEKERVAAESRALQDNIAKLTEALEKSLEANKLLGIQVYAEQRLAQHPQAAKVRKLIEQAEPSTRSEVDDLLEAQREPALDADDLEETRNRVRAKLKGGKGSTPLNEEKPSTSSRGSADYNGLGVDLGTLRALSGMRAPRAQS
jgi:hypothetical protein